MSASRKGTTAEKPAADVKEEQKPAEDSAPVSLIAQAGAEKVERARRVYVDVTPVVTDPEDATTAYIVQREQRADGSEGPLELCTRRRMKSGTSEQRAKLAPIASAHRAFAEADDVPPLFA